MKPCEECVSALHHQEWRQHLGTPHIQEWEWSNGGRERNQSATKLPCKCISFYFPWHFRWWFLSNRLVTSNPSSRLVEECEKNNISKTQHDPTMDSWDMATRALLVSPKSALLSLFEFSLLSLTFFFLELVASLQFYRHFFP
jgi:hypothetical protein